MIRFLSIVVLASAVAGFLPQQKSGQPVADSAPLSVPELVEYLDAVDSPKSKNNGDYEAVLQKILQRGGAEAERLLMSMLGQHAKRYQALLDSWTQLDAVERTSSNGRRVSANLVRYQPNLELLTTLRRIQGQPDPLQIEVSLTQDADAWTKHHGLSEFLKERYGAIPSAGRLKEELTEAERAFRAESDNLAKLDREQEPKRWDEVAGRVGHLKDAVHFLKLRVEWTRELEELAPRATESKMAANLTATSLALPTFVVALVSSDREQLSFWLNRGHYPPRFRFDVTDSNGRTLPIRPTIPTFFGGVAAGRIMKHGTTWKVAIPMSDYLEIETPGEYTVSLQYHDSKSIAYVRESESLSDRIIFRSKPFKMTVK